MAIPKRKYLRHSAGERSRLCENLRQGRARKNVPSRYRSQEDIGSFLRNLGHPGIFFSQGIREGDIREPVRSCHCDGAGRATRSLVGARRLVCSQRRFSGSLITRTWYMSAPSRCSYHAFAVHTRGLSSHCGIACIAAPSRGACIMENGRTDCVVITSKPHPSFSFDPSFE